MTDDRARKLFEPIRRGDYSVLSKPKSLDEATLAKLACLIRPHTDIYRPLLLATTAMPRHPRGGYDWNLGFIVRGLDPEILAEVVHSQENALLGSEGLAWGLGELGSDDERIVSFLYTACERCANYKAWWCAGIALEKLRLCDSVDILKRTLKGRQWNDLGYCFKHLGERAARIAVLRLTRFDNLWSMVIPRCIAALDSTDPDTVENAVWLLERLHVSDEDVISKLMRLLEKSEEVSHSLHPRIVEALGEIATERCRTVLEEAVVDAPYYRTRAYAARGLGKIGNQKSLDILERAFESEIEPSVVSELSEAIYTIKDDRKRRLSLLRRDSGWPENGMISDASNRWYGNPDVYDKFSQAEDPENVTFSFAVGLIPDNAQRVVDIGTGTGRFAAFIMKKRPNIQAVVALDLSSEMLQFIARTMRRQLVQPKPRFSLVRGDTGKLPFGAASIDCVVSSWGFPSAMWNRHQCITELEEVLRILRPGGALITVGWDETFQDQLSELWYRFVPEPDFRRETLEEWRRRRRKRIRSPRNCYLTFKKTNIRVPLRFEGVEDAAGTLGHLFGFSAGDWVIRQERREFSINVGITFDTKEDLHLAIERLRADLSHQSKGEGGVG